VKHQLTKKPKKQLPAGELEGSDCAPYVAFAGDTFLDCDDTLDGLIAAVLTTWDVGAGEDVVIWRDDRQVAAVIKGRGNALQGEAAEPPEVIRLDGKRAA
jgi:hypothetical protein